MYVCVMCTVVYYGRKYYADKQHRKKVYVISAEEEAKDCELDKKVVPYSPTTCKMESGQQSKFSFIHESLYDDADPSVVVFESKLKPVDFDSIFAPVSSPGLSQSLTTIGTASFLRGKPRSSTIVPATATLASTGSFSATAGATATTLFAQSQSLKLTISSKASAKVGVDVLQAFSPAAAAAYAAFQVEESKEAPLAMDSEQISAFRTKLDGLIAAPTQKHPSGAKVAPLAAKRLNSAVIFTKAHGATPAAQFLINTALDDHHIRILSRGRYTAAEAVEMRLFEAQYAHIHHHAQSIPAKDVSLSTEESSLFAATFGETWTDVVKAQRVWNAAAARSNLSFSAESLYDIWRHAPVQLRLRRGLQICRVDAANATANRALVEDITDPLYIINGFYPSMQAALAAVETITFLVVEWDGAALSWADLVNTVVGHSDPILAQAESIRGKLYQQWGELGLASPPDRRDNCIHVSKSAFEALGERLVWCKDSLLFTDSFGSRLLSCNIPSLTVQNWLKNPTIQGKTVFDHMYALEGEECLLKAQSLLCKRALPVSFLSFSEIVVTPVCLCCWSCSFRCGSQRKPRHIAESKGHHQR
jgi:hypothetical protein